MEKSQILLIDDDTDMYPILKRCITESMDLDYAQTLNEGKEKIINKNYDLILIDYQIGDYNALEFLKNYDKSSQLNNYMKIILITGSDDKETEIRTHKMGIRDFIRKPIYPDVVKAILEKHLFNLKKEETGIQKNGPVEFNLSQLNARIIIHDKVFHLDLTPKEFEILYLLSTHPNKIFSREDIFLKVWDKEERAYSRTVDMHISSLRKKLGEFGDWILTRRGKGYSLNFSYTPPQFSLETNITI